MRSQAAIKQVDLEMLHDNEIPIDRDEDQEQNSSIDWITWSKEIFKLLTDQEMVNVAHSIKPDIDGFALGRGKSYEKVPKSMLRRKTMQKLQKLMKPDELLHNSLYKHTLREYKRTATVEELIWKMKKEECSAGEQIYLIGQLFPDYFIEHEQMIRANIEAGRDVCGGMEAELSFSSAIRALVNKDKLDQIEDLLLKFVKSDAEKKVWIETMQNPDQTLKDYILNAASDFEYGGYLLLSMLYREEWNTWNDEERQALLELVHYDAIQYSLQLATEAMDEKQVHEQRAQQLEQLEKKLKAEQTKSKKKQGEYSRKLDQITTEYQQLEQQLKELQIREIKLCHDNEELNKERRKLTSELEKREPLVADERVRLITMRPAVSFHTYIAKTCVCHVPQVEQIGRFIQSRPNYNEIYWFIDMEQLTTAQSFHLEQELRQLNIPFRLVSGSPASLTCKVIYNLEGAMAYEA
ncbi:hypothetical protein [Paenibacillus marinisediminis]